MDRYQTNFIFTTLDVTNYLKFNYIGKDLRRRNSSEHNRRGSIYLLKYFYFTGVKHSRLFSQRCRKPSSTFGNHSTCIQLKIRRSVLMDTGKRKTDQQRGVNSQRKEEEVWCKQAVNEVLWILLSSQKFSKGIRNKAFLFTNSPNSCAQTNKATLPVRTRNSRLYNKKYARQHLVGLALEWENISQTYW